MLYYINDTGATSCVAGDHASFFADTSIQASASSSSTKVKSNKKGVNYASVTCGAKIVSVNPEAQNTVFVLMENKDQYMINPCKAKKL